MWNMPSRNVLYEWADQTLKGRLKGQLLRWRAQGVSHEEVARRLRDKGVTVSRETVRRWYLDMKDAA